MKQNHRKSVVLSKASNSTTSDNQYADAALINEQGKAMNNNTTAIVNGFVQQNSTNTIMYIAIVGIIAYMIYLNFKKK